MPFAWGESIEHIDPGRNFILSPALILPTALEESHMRKLLLVASLAAGALVIAPVTSASAFVPVQTEIAGATAAMNDIIQVKRKKTARPRGWDRGRKVGWRGGRTPPGQRR